MLPLFCFQTFIHLFVGCVFCLGHGLFRFPFCLLVNLLHPQSFLLICAPQKISKTLLLILYFDMDVFVPPPGLLMPTSLSRCDP
ncbi:hypothetical protein Hanom_Chr13g01208781 [Helianthus anomalus]